MAQNPPIASHLHKFLRRHWKAAAAAIFALYPLVVLHSPLAYTLRLLGIVGLYIILALGLNVTLGFVGLFDLGFMAFYAIGAYTATWMALAGWNFWCATLAAMAVATAVRVALGAPVLRLKGDYLAIVTLGFGEITRIALNNCDRFTNGPKGLPRVGEAFAPFQIFGLAMTENVHFYYLILASVLLAAAVSSRLNRSRIGRAWTAVREDAVAAEMCGVPVTRVKMLAFAASGLFAGLAGSLFAHWEKFVTPESFTFWESVLVVSTIVLGGMGSIRGVILGTALIAGLPLVLQMTLGSHWIQYRYLIFGAVLILVIIFRPQGLIPSRRRQLELTHDPA